MQIYDKYGNKENTIELEINNAIYTSYDKYLAIAESNGKKLYVIYNKNILWEDEIDGNIEKIEINKNGYIAVKASDTNYNSIIIVYNSEGKELFRKYLSNTVVDIDISSDSEHLAYAELNTSGVLIQSAIKIISINKAINDSEHSTLYEYTADVNKLILNIEYQDKNKLVCLYDKSIDVIEDNKNREIVNIENKNAVFVSIDFDNVVAYVEEKTVGTSAESILTIVNTSTGKENTYVTNQVVKQVSSANNVIALNLGTELHVVAKNGWLVKKYISENELYDFVISKGVVGIIDSNRVLVFDI